MNTYQIAGINIAYHYKANAYFDHNISHYATLEAPIYSIHVDIVDEIKKPTKTPTLILEGKYIFHTDQEEIIYGFNQTKAITHQVKRTHDFKTNHITLSKTANTDLNEAEYVLSGMLFFDIALKENIIALHGAALAHQNQAIIFSAPSKTGKSTHANLWVKHLKDITIINDDKPLLKEINNQIVVFGSPWAGKTGINTNISLPLKEILFLKQDNENILTPMTTQEKLTHLMKNVYRPYQETQYPALLTQIEKIIKTIPLTYYACNMEKNAFTKAYHHLFKH